MNRITLIDTYNDRAEYQDVVDFCEANEYEIPTEGSRRDNNIRAELDGFQLEDFWSNLKYSKLGTCIVMGTLGLWDGTHEIEPKVFKTLYDAVSACADGANDMIVLQDHSTINVTALHHDGRNNFTIRILNDKGCDALSEGKEVDLTRRCYHKTLKDYIY